MPSPTYVVAVIDDEEILRESVRNLLTAHGYGVEVYDSAEDFLVAVATSRANCLLIDVHLHGVSGIELGRGLARAGFRFPVIYMTGSPTEMIRGRAMEAGCVAFLTKPFTPGALVAALTEAEARGFMC
jgi:FixJ family two-component response regulator